jgi:hypothetical protein
VGLLHKGVSNPRSLHHVGTLVATRTTRLPLLGSNCTASNTLFWTSVFGLHAWALQWPARLSPSSSLIQPPPPCPSPSIVPACPTEGPALLDALKKQVEFYFSKDNLATDAYLVSQMNGSHFVPISTILEVRGVSSGSPLFLGSYCVSTHVVTCHCDSRRQLLWVHDASLLWVLVSTPAGSCPLVSLVRVATRSFLIGHLHVP